MNIQKEVEKFEAKKSKLVTDFVQKLTTYVNSQYKAIGQIDKTMETLNNEKHLAETKAEEAREAIREVK